MLPEVALLAVQAALIAVKAAPGVDCPSAAQVSTAVEARLPGVLVPVAPLADAKVWQLILSSDPAAGTHGFQLVGAGGRVLLTRSLPLMPAGARERDCPALADSIALIVERYLQELQYGGEPAAGGGDVEAAATLGAVGELPDGMGHRWDVFLGARWRPGGTGGSVYELRAGGARALGRGRRLSLGLAVGVEGAAAHRWRGGSGTLRRFPAEARLVWRFAAGLRSMIEAGGVAGAELLVLDASSAGERRRQAMLAPAAGLTAGWRFSIGRRGFVRVVATAAVAFLRYDFVVPDIDGDVIFGTPRAYGKLGAEAGLSFW